MGIKLIQDNIKPEDKNIAINVKNYLVAGNRVIGDPGEGLKQTLAQLEERRDNRDFSVTDWVVKDAELNQQIAMTKAGIEGETQLCDYLAILIKNDDKLNGLVAFASLAYDFGEENDKEYIPDTDTLLVYGNHLLVVDAKNIKTKPGHPLQMIGGVIVDDRGKEVLECHPSTHIWEKVMQQNNIPLGSIDGYVCIVNDTETDIIRDDEWHNCHTKLIHVSELKEILETWVQGKDNTLYLNMLTEIAKAQIKKANDITFDVNSIKRRFGI
jgi:hypothetical protein